MSTFERLLIENKQTHAEPRNPYYDLYNDESACTGILKEFGLNNPHSHIINGHIPVIRAKGESPIKANGRLIVIDGGFCHHYQEKPEPRATPWFITHTVCELSPTKGSTGF